MLVGIHNVVERRVFLGGGPPALGAGAASVGGLRESAAGALRESATPSVVVQAEGQQQCGPLGYSAETLEGAGLYRLGIIDPLQRWDLKKQSERLLKILLRLRCSAKLKNGMSAVEPAEYARRFHLMVGMKLLGLSKDVVQRDWEDETRNRGFQPQPLPLRQRQGSWRGMSWTAMDK